MFDAVAESDVDAAGYDEPLLSVRVSEVGKWMDSGEELHDESLSCLGAISVGGSPRLDRWSVEPCTGCFA